VLNLQNLTTSQNAHSQRLDENANELRASLTEIKNTQQYQQSLNDTSKQQARENGARLEKISAQLEEISAQLKENSVQLNDNKEQARKQQSRYEALLRVLYTKGQERLNNTVAKAEATQAAVIRTLDTVTDTQDVAKRIHETGEKLLQIFTI
jgi:septal ring factor EnvC (AmiA/AmiB activator)